MGRPPLHMTRTHLNLPPELIARMDAIVGEKGRSKFVRQALAKLLDRLAPVPGTVAGDIFEYDGGHEPRLSAAGTAAMLAVIRKRGFDVVMQSLDFKDPAEFLHFLLGHSELPNATVTSVSSLLVAYRLSR